MDDITEPLRKPARPARNALLIGAGALVIAGTTWGGIAIAQSGQPADEVGFVASEPTETPEVPNVAPTATAQVTGQTDLTVTVTGTGADTDGQITHQGWNFGDGTFADGPDATHTYSAAGTYTITFAVSDDDGESASATIDVTVTAPPPPPAPEPPAQPSTPAYGQYPPGYPMPMIPGTDAPDTSACASSTGTVNGQGVPVCA